MKKYELVERDKTWMIVNDDSIVLKQMYCGEEHVVLFNDDDLPKLIEWIQEVLRSREE